MKKILLLLSLFCLSLRAADKDVIIGQVDNTGTILWRVVSPQASSVLSFDAGKLMGTTLLSSLGTGTVTNVSVVTANGVSGIVANPTTTPAITISLAAITPTTVTASGAVTGSNLSGTNTGDQTTIVGITGTLAQFNNALTGADFATGGGTATGTNTGDQTITLTGNVTGSGTGSFATTIAADAVANSMLANMAQSTIKGRAAGAGTGDPTDLTATQATAIINEMVPDSGSGVTKGLVPAASTGNASTHFLRKDGQWVAPAGSGGNVTTSATLTAGRVILGNGGSDIGRMGADGNATDVLHGGAGGPSWSKVNLTNEVIGTLLTISGGTGNSAGSIDALTTTGTKVTVSGAAPPTTGQTLTATSATTADWQSPAVATSSLTSNYTNATNANVDTGLSFSALASTTYFIDAQLTVTSPAAGSRIQITAPAGSTVKVQTILNIGTSTSQVAVTAINTPTSITSSVITGFSLTVRGTVTVAGTPGTVAIGFLSITNGQTTTVDSGSGMVSFRK